MSKIEALLEVIHLCEENPRLVRALEDLLTEDGPVKVAPENGAAPKQQGGKSKAAEEKDAASKQQAPKDQKAPTEEVKAEADTKPKKRSGGGGRKPSVDTGRIKALRTGGWKIAEIADDVGCSQQTVRNNLQKMGMR